MKFLIPISMAVFLSACTPSYAPVSMPMLPEELKDCGFFSVSNGTDRMYVVRCPNSTTSTTYRVGKHDETTVVIDGAEYVRKDTK